MTAEACRNRRKLRGDNYYVGLFPKVLAGRIFNRGEATARKVVTKYQIRDANSLLVGCSIVLRPFSLCQKIDEIIPFFR
jgi:hypothetical protein